MDKQVFPKQVDVLIAGSGPAGLFATSELIKGGASVLTVDARQVIGKPVRCGELSRRLLFETFKLEPQPGWIRWRLKEQGAAIVLDREKFEGDFSRRLNEDGADIRANIGVVGVGPFDGTGRKVTLASGGDRHEVMARCIIAADGVSSRVAQMCGVNTFLALDDLGSCLAYRLNECELADPHSSFIRYLPHHFPFYFWIIPSGLHEANVGIVLPSRQGFLLKKALAKALATGKGLVGGKIVKTVVGLYSLTLPLPKPYADGLLIAGGAARMVDRRTGEGIWHAAVSGTAAARTILESRGSFTAEYLAAYRRRLEPLYLDLEEKFKVTEPERQNAGKTAG